MTVVDRALAWLKSQWIAPDVSVFLHKAIASMACGGCGAVVTEPAWCPACAKVIEESARSDDQQPSDGCPVATLGLAEVSGVSPVSPSPDFPPAAVERRGSVPCSKTFRSSTGTDVTCGFPAYGNQLERYRLSMERVGGACCPSHGGPDAPKHLTIELPDKTVVDVSKLDGEK